jgi:hypothetical protein
MLLNLKLKAPCGQECWKISVKLDLLEMAGLLLVNVMRTTVTSPKNLGSSVSNPQVEVASRYGKSGNHSPYNELMIVGNRWPIALIYANKP